MDPELITKTGEHFLTGSDALTSFMFFVICLLVTAVGVLYRRNQKQNDDTVQLVKDTGEVIRESVKTLAVLSERIENAIRSKD